MGEVAIIVLSNLGTVLTAVGGFWYVVRKQGRSDKRAAARIVWEDKEKEVDVKQVETDNAIGNYKATMMNLLAERKKAHDADIRRLEDQTKETTLRMDTLLGEMGRKLDECERKHERSEKKHASKDRLIIQLIERMKGAGELSDDEAREMYAKLEEDSHDPDK